jgi:hypothetical protein
MEAAWQWTDIFWRLAIMAFGFAIFQSPNSTAALNNAPLAQRGIASSMVSFNRNLGTILGVAIAAAIWYSIRENLIHAAGANSTLLEFELPGMKTVYYIMSGLILVAAVISYKRDDNKEKVVL